MRYTFANLKILYGGIRAFAPLREAFLLLLISALPALAQKPFTEGTLVYQVKIKSPSNKEFTGTYTYIFKGNQVRKELKLSNGFRDVQLLNCGANTIYSLQNRDNKHYAIELSTDDIHKLQDRYTGFSMSGETTSGQQIAGTATMRANVKYRDGSGGNVLYTKEWYPPHPIIFDRFPSANFLPLQYAYTDEDGTQMEFEATKLEAATVENAIFRIPQDYIIISYKEYKQLNN